MDEPADLSDFPPCSHFIQVEVYDWDTRTSLTFDRDLQRLVEWIKDYPLVHLDATRYTVVNRERMETLANDLKRPTFVVTYTSPTKVVSHGYRYTSEVKQRVEQLYRSGFRG